MLPPFRRHIPRVATFANLGAENRTLGEHIAEGKGFADVFAFGTGPTAWMSPAYPLLVASLLRLFGGDMDAAGIAVAIGQAIGLMFIWCAWSGPFDRDRERKDGRCSRCLSSSC